MGNAMFLKEYLVALGIKDNFTGKLNQVLNQSSKKVAIFTKGFATAGSAVASLLLAANIGIAKFVTNLVKADDELDKFANQIGKSKEEAFSTKAALDAMGKTMDEVGKNPELHNTFIQLKRDAEAIKPPDLSDGLKQVRDIQFEFTRFKQSITYAVQWVGHYLFKYLQQPLQKIRELFGGLNDGIIKNIPKWTEKIALVMASAVKLGTAVIRGAKDIFNVIKKIFDMIPNEIKLVGVALTALGILIKMGPFGWIVAIISAALLLLEDFYTYIDGGQALLGGFWQKLIDIWELLKDNGIIENFQTAFEKAGGAIGNVFSAVQEIINAVSGAISDISGEGEPFLVWLLSEALPGAIELVAEAVDVIANALKWFFSLTIVHDIIKMSIGVISDYFTKVIGNITAFINIIKKFFSGDFQGVFQEIVNIWNNTVTFFRSVSRRINAIFAPFVNWVKNIFQRAKNKIVDIFSDIGSWFGSRWRDIQNAFSGITKWFHDKFQATKNTISNVFGNIGAWFSTRWIEIKNVFNVVKEWFNEKFQDARNVINYIFIGIGTWFGDRWTDIKNIFSNVSAWFRLKFQAAKNSVTNAFLTIGSWFGERWNDIKNVFAGVSNWFGLIFLAAKNRIIDAFKNISAWFGERWENIKGAFDNVAGWFKGQFEAAKKSVTSAFQSIGGWFGNRFLDIKRVFSGIKTWFSEKFEAAKKSVTDAFKNIGNWFGERWAEIVNVFSDIQSFFSSAFYAAVKAIELTFGALVSFFSSIWKKIKIVFVSIKSFFSSRFRGAYNAVIEIWESIKGFFEGIFNNIKETFEPVIKWFSDTFASAKKGVIDAFKAIGGWFGNRWNDIKFAFFGVSTWFGNIFQNAKDIVLEKFEDIGSWFGERWTDIKSAFFGIATWFKIKFDSALKAIKKVFSGIGAWFTRRKNEIVNAFTSIPDKIKEKFEEVVSKIKEVFEPIVQWFKDIVGEIVGAFSGISESVGGAISAVKGFLGLESDSVGLPEGAEVVNIEPVTREDGSTFSGGSVAFDDAIRDPNYAGKRGHADGGIFGKEHIARFAEGDKPEAIIPLTKPTRAREVLSGAMNYLGIETPEKLSGKLDSLIQFASTMSNKLNALNTGLNQDISSAYTTNITNYYNHTFDMKSNYTITDTSGRPESVANAVDRTKAIQLRNLQGVLSS